MVEQFQAFADQVVSASVYGASIAVAFGFAVVAVTSVLRVIVIR
jgi:hypothetical protein